MWIIIKTSHFVCSRHVGIVWENWKVFEHLQTTFYCLFFQVSSLNVRIMIRSCLSPSRLVLSSGWNILNVVIRHSFRMHHEMTVQGSSQVFQQDWQICMSCQVVLLTSNKRLGQSWVMVSFVFSFRPYLGRWSNLTNNFQMGWNQKTRKAFLLGGLSHHVFHHRTASFHPDQHTKKNLTPQLQSSPHLFWTNQRLEPFWSQPKIQQKSPFFFSKSGRRVHVFWEFGVQ